MRTCLGCGNELIEGTKFCSFCGKPIEVMVNENFRKETEPKQKDGIIATGEKKCPNCGAVIKYTDVVCEYCGTEFNRSDVYSSVKRFIDKIKEYHLKIQEYSNVNMFDSFSSSATTYFNFQKKIDPAQKQKLETELIHYIINYQIQNSIGEITEFMIFAASNVNYRVYDTGNTSSTGAGSTEELTFMRKESNAWQTKMEQAYNKAKVMFGNRPEFSQIESIYSQTRKDVKTAENRGNDQSTKIFMGYLKFMGIFILAFMIFGIIMVAMDKCSGGSSIDEQSGIESTSEGEKSDKSSNKSYDNDKNDDISDDTTSSENKSSKYISGINFEELDVDGIYPQSDFDSPLIANIMMAPEIIYHTLASENKLGDTPYVVTGKVVKILHGFNEIREYYNSEPEEDDGGNNGYTAFVLENEYGNVLIYDLATYDVGYFKEEIANGKIKMDDWLNKYINEFGGYSKYEYPKEGKTVAILCIYSGYSQRFNVPLCYFVTAF